MYKEDSNGRVWNGVVINNHLMAEIDKKTINSHQTRTSNIGFHGSTDTVDFAKYQHENTNKNPFL